MALSFKDPQRFSHFGLIFAVLFVLSVLFLVMYCIEGNIGFFHSIQNATGLVASPLTYAGAQVGSAVESTSEAVHDATADEDTLSSLSEQNAQLRELLAESEEYRLEAQRLQDLLDLADQYEVNGVGARIIGRSSEAWSQTITLNKGENDGIDAGQTVMGSAGVIGQVVATSTSTATVRLLTDSSSGVAVLIQSNRAEGILRGSLEGLLYLEGIDTNVALQVGDVVLTSGLGGSYVSGLLVGSVVRIDTQADGSSRTVVVSPNESTSLLEEVLIVMDPASKNSSATDSSNVSSSFESGDKE